MSALVRPPEFTAQQTDDIAATRAKIVPGRSCGSCTLCCKVMHVEPLAKPAGRWCADCVRGEGCGAYETRPFVCRVFYCEWMVANGLGPEWKPDRAKFVLFKSAAGRRLTAYVDPGYPAAWRRSPYYENFKVWAMQAVRSDPRMQLVDIMVGDRCTVILPDRDVDVGVVAADELVTLYKTVGPAGDIIEARKTKRSEAAGASVYEAAAS